MRLPRSRAKTAWGLLKDIKRAILAEPLRCNMGIVLDRTMDSGLPHPACGAVGCVAGWGLILTGRTFEGQRVYNQTNEAAKLMGLTYGQGQELFFPQDLVSAEKKQTPEHAKAVAEHIDSFMEENKKQLQAHRIV